MLDPVFTFIEKLIEQFSWKRLLFVISLLGLFMTGLIIFESYTGHFRLARIDKSADIIVKLNTLPPDISQQSKEILASATKGIAKDIDGFTNGNSTPFSIHKDSLKVIAALVPWLIFAVLLSLAGGNGTAAALGAIILFALFSGLIGYFLPLFEREWINYVAYPFGFCFLMVWLVVMWQKKPALT